MRKCVTDSCCDPRVRYRGQDGGSLFTYSRSFFAYSPMRCLLDALSICKQRSSTVNKRAPLASKKPSNCKQKVPKHNCKQRSSTVGRKLPAAKRLHPKCLDNGEIDMLGSKHAFFGVALGAGLWAYLTYSLNTQSLLQEGIEYPPKLNQMAPRGDPRNAF